MPHLFEPSIINCTCGVDVLLVDLSCSPLKLVVVFTCETVELDRSTAQFAGAAKWCLDLDKAIRQLFTKRPLFSSSSCCNFIIRLIVIIIINALVF